MNPMQDKQQGLYDEELFDTNKLNCSSIGRFGVSWGFRSRGGDKKVRSGLLRSPRATLMPNQLFILVSPPLDPEMATPLF